MIKKIKAKLLNVGMRIFDHIDGDNVICEIRYNQEAELITIVCESGRVLTSSPEKQWDVEVK